MIKKKKKIKIKSSKNVKRMLIRNLSVNNKTQFLLWSFYKASVTNRQNLPWLIKMD